jgi:hypothetical protein
LRPTPTPVALPEFLFSVFPEPGSTNEIGDLLFGGVVLNLPEIAIPGETLDLTDLQARTQFLLDGRPLTVTLALDYERPEVGARVWAEIDPTLGKNQATIRVRRTSGEVLEFSWGFTADVYTFILPGLPEGFQFVRPLPDSTITREEYRQEGLIPAEYVPGFTRLRGRVCVGVLGYEIAGRPSYFTAEEVHEMFSIASLDGRPPDTEAIAGGYEVPTEVVVFCGDPPDTTVCTPTRAQYDVSAHHYKCWVGDLAPGRHEATAVLEWPDGHVTEFTWWFVITED